MCICEVEVKCSVWLLCFRSVYCVHRSAFWTVDFVCTTTFIDAMKVCSSVVVELSADVECHCSLSCSTPKICAELVCVAKIFTSLAIIQHYTTLCATHLQYYMINDIFAAPSSTGQAFINETFRPRTTHL